MMNGHGKSDGCVIPAKPPNKEGGRKRQSHGGPYWDTKAETLETDKGRPTAEATGSRPTTEAVEERRPAKGNLPQQTMRRTQSRERMQQALERVRQAVRTTAFASLTQGRSPVRERRTLGSVRGAPGDWRPYREGWGSVRAPGLLGCVAKQTGGKRDER